VRYDPFTGLEDHPIHFQRWTVRVIKYFFGDDRIFLRCAEKNSIVPLASVIDLSLMGGPPEGGSPLGGDPP